MLGPTDAEIVRLIRQLADIEAALVNAMRGTADVVVDAGGHQHLLRAAQQALIESEQRAQSHVALLDAVLASAPDYISYVGVDRTIQWVNRHANGVGPAQLVGTHWLSLLPIEHRAELEATMDRVFATGEVASHEGVGLGVGDQLGWYARHFGPVRRNGQVIGVVVISRDVTGAKRASDEIRRLNDNLEQLAEERTAELRVVNAELEAFSYSVAHDLRAPLRAIDGFASVVLEDHGATLPPDGRYFLQRVLAATARAGVMIEAMLDLARIHRAPIRHEAVDLETIASTIIDELRLRDRERVVRFEAIGDLVAHGDAGLLTVLLQNLIGNAWKFTSKRPFASITLARVDAAEPTFVVRDDGAGFDMTLASKLFKPFQRMHLASDFEGTGVGLATVQRIVARHGGRVWVKAELDRGAEIFFCLPVTASG